MSRIARWTLIAFVLLFAWMIVSGWRTDSPGDRVVEATLAGLLVIFVLGLAAPSRFFLAFRIVAGAVALTFTVYFVAELLALMRGVPQPIRLGRPSAVMAGLGFVVFGIPAALFAFGGMGVGLVARLLNHQPTKPKRDDAAV